LEEATLGIHGGGVEGEESSWRVVGTGS